MPGEFTDDRPERRALWRDWVWVLTWAALSSVWCAMAARQLSATFDEVGYLKVGLDRWQTGSFRQLKHMGTMPLPVDVCTLPLTLAERATGRPIDLDADLAYWLPVARAAALSFWWLLLIYAWRTGNLLAGPWAGRWAVAVLSVEPSFLGHAGLAATDVASAACLLALAFHYRTARDRPGWRGWVAPVCWCALALLAKASAVVYAPICLMAAECDYRLRAGLFAGLSWRQRMGQLVQAARRVVAVAGLGFILASLYCSPDPGHGHGVLRYVHFWQAAEAVAFQIRHNAIGHGGTYLLGAWSDTALWYYFPALLTIKLPIPLLAVPLLIVLVRPRALANWAVAAAGIILLMSLTCRIQIGIRYLLPGLALAAVGLSAAGVCAWRGLQAGAARRAFALLTGAAVVATALAAVHVWPHGLSYTNGLWGPADRGYLLVSDSNYDWGQGLYELAAWQRSTAAGPLDVAYFGTDPSLARLNMHFVALPNLALDAPTPPHKLAVSTTALFGHPHSQSASARRLRSLTPAARTTTYLIYDLPAAGG
jgi:hypothetical protein